MKPNAINMESVKYSIPVGGSVTYLSDNNNGSTYLLWVTQDSVFTPPINLPSGWSVYSPFYPIGGEFSFNPVNGWNLIMDDQNNVYLKIH